jgi:hypothetical protein
MTTHSYKVCFIHLIVSLLFRPDFGFHVIADCDLKFSIFVFWKLCNSGYVSVNVCYKEISEVTNRRKVFK